ncbi:MAG: ATP-binding protein [Candidatus Riflebacteria bacterium]|nr:ATP-binding protein [Candidatus Riflebacteria bacterium]
MVFVGGPRQVGKTTLCLRFLDPPRVTNPNYLNWDDLADQQNIRQGRLPGGPLVVLDEIHKFKNWRNLVKGFYDKKKDVQKFLVTGSARLDYYRRGGDSLLGRYRYLRLHPLSVSELRLETAADIEHLLRFGGFPEPFFAGRERDWKLWTRERLYRLINDDLRTLEFVRDLSNIEIMAEALGERVGSPLSVNNLAQDLQVNFRTAEAWLSILERLYFCFRIMPYVPPRIKAVKKEKKLYLWDWSTVESPGPRFENLVASHLLKYCHFLEDTLGERMELRFLRDVDKHEIDFVVLKNRKPLFAVECKTGERRLSPHIGYFKPRTDIPLFYQVHLGKSAFEPEARVKVLPFATFCAEAGLV